MKYKGLIGMILYLFLMIYIIIFSTQALSLQYHIIVPLRAPEPQEYANFGLSLAIGSETLVIGESNSDISGLQNAGKAYIFDLDGNLLNMLQAQEPELHAYFGYAVAINSALVLIGEPTADDLDIMDAGRVYIFDHDGNLLNTLTAPEPQDYANFGWSVDFGEDILVIGEPGADTEGKVSAGKVYIFDHDGNLLNTLQAQEPQAYSNFGHAVALNEDILSIGECYAGIGSKNETGRAYIFDHDGNLLNTLTAPEPQDYANFGWSVDVGEDILVIGEPGANAEGIVNSGRAYIFNFEGNLTKTLQAQTTQASAEFGKSLTVSKEYIFVGEPGGTIASIFGAGIVHVFNVDGNLQGIIQSPNPQYGGAFGTSLSVNEDRMAIGEGKADVGGITFAGRTYIVQLIKEDKATFILSNLTINPISVEVGQIITISIEVTNRGGRDGTYNVTLTINGESEDNKYMSLNSNETETVTFEVLTVQQGTYSVKVNGLSSSYSVTSPIEDEKSFRDILVFTFVLIVLGVLVGIFALWFLFYKKKIKINR